MDDESVYSTNYYRGRERAARALADQAASPAIRDIHLEMAAQYRALVEEPEPPPSSEPAGSGADVVRNPI